MVRQASHGCLQVRVSRRHILDSAQKVMGLYAASRVVLELEYFGEVGTGLGPTLEFYTLLAHELQVQGPVQTILSAVAEYMSRIQAIQFVINVKHHGAHSWRCHPCTRVKNTCGEGTPHIYF